MLLFVVVVVVVVAVAVAVAVAAVVFMLNRSFYLTSAVPPVSFLIRHPRETQNYVVTDM